MHQQLTDGLDQLGLSLDGLADKLNAYLDLLVFWNKTYNLTAIKNRDDMVVRHILDSLAPHAYFQHKPLLDIGTGAGLPGIPLLLAGVVPSVGLVETNNKKARFMREVARQLNLDAATVFQARCETLSAEHAAPQVTSRAFASLHDMVHWCAHLLADGGQFIALKGPGVDDELTQLPEGFTCTGKHPVTVPFEDSQRFVAVIERISG